MNISELIEHMSRQPRSNSVCIHTDCDLITMSFDIAGCQINCDRFEIHVYDRKKCERKYWTIGILIRILEDIQQYWPQDRPVVFVDCRTGKHVRYNIGKVYDYETFSMLVCDY